MSKPQNLMNSTKKSHIINYTSLQGKTRLESLVDRIHSANKEINTLFGSIQVNNQEIKENKENKENKNKDNKDNKENNINNSTIKPPKTLNEIITEDNNKSVQVGLDDNNNIENSNNENNNNENNNNEKNNIENNNEKKEINEDSENKENQEINNIINNNNNTESQNKNNNNLDIEIPFIKKTKNLLNELKKLKENGEMKEDDINNEIEELPKRAMVEMSLSDFKIKKIN